MVRLQEVGQPTFLRWLTQAPVSDFLSLLEAGPKGRTSLLEALGFSSNTHFLIEGRHAVAAAIEHRAALELVLTTGEEAEFAQLVTPPVYAIDKGTLSAWLRFDFHRGHLAIARRPIQTFGDWLPTDRAVKVAALCGLADPGNVGTIIRNAAAFDFDAVICDTKGADPFNAKSVRASATTVFQIPVFRLSLFLEQTELFNATKHNISLHLKNTF